MIIVMGLFKVAHKLLFSENFFIIITSEMHFLDLLGAIATSIDLVHLHILGDFEFCVAMEAHLLSRLFRSHPYR